jgi:hypothetical protein
MSDFDFLASLDAEIAQATAKPKLEKDRKALMVKLRDNRLSRQAVTSLRNELSAVDQMLDSIIWTPMAAVAFFVQQDCDACGSTHKVFLQHMEKQSAGTHNPTTRYKRVRRPNSDLPCEVIVQQTTTHICADCCEDFGFSFPSAEIKFVSTEAPFAPCPTSEQDDLYAQT